MNENFYIQFNWSLFLRIQLSSIGSGNGLGPNRRQAIIWANAYPVHGYIYATLGEDELISSVKSRCQNTMGRTLLWGYFFGVSSKTNMIKILDAETHLMAGHKCDFKLWFWASWVANIVIRSFPNTMDNCGLALLPRVLVNGRTKTHFEIAEKIVTETRRLSRSLICSRWLRLRQSCWPLNMQLVTAFRLSGCYLVIASLTHGYPNKMADICRRHFQILVSKRNTVVFIQILLYRVAKGLVHIKFGYWFGAKPFPERMVLLFNDAYETSVPNESSIP